MYVLHRQSWATGFSKVSRSLHQPRVHGYLWPKLQSPGCLHVVLISWWVALHLMILTEPEPLIWHESPLATLGLTGFCDERICQSTFFVLSSATIGHLKGYHNEYCA